MENNIAERLLHVSPRWKYSWVFHDGNVTVLDRLLTNITFLYYVLL